MKNIPASIRARLSNQAKETGTSYQSLLESFAIGRLLWRISKDEQASKFVLKGAQLFGIWAAELHRPTRDIDLLGYGDPSPEAIEKHFKALLSGSAIPDDGLVWTVSKVAPIRDDQRYGGVRLNLTANLERTQIAVQVDIGYGDAITPAVETHTWKELLDYPEARLLTYPPETVIAEKLEAAVELQLGNSRMKDFFDLDWLQANRTFDYQVLSEAIQNTFDRRGSPLPTHTPIALTPDFSSDTNKATQWNAFLRKNKLPTQDLQEVIQRLQIFLHPVLFPPISPPTHWAPLSGWLSF